MNRSTDKSTERTRALALTIFWIGMTILMGIVLSPGARFAFETVNRIRLTLNGGF